MTSCEEQCESVVLGFVGRIPYRYHRVIAISRAPIRDRLRGTLLHTTREHLEDVGVFLVHASTGQQQRTRLSLRFQNKVYAPIEGTKPSSQKH